MHHPGPLDARPAVDAARRRRRALLHRLVQPRVGARWRRPASPLWSYFPKLNDDLVAAQTHSPYTRGIALGHGKVFVGTVDGRLIAIDQKTGQPAWDTKLINSEKLTVGFTGAPLLVKDKVIIGAQGGEWPGRGPIFGVDANSGQQDVGVPHGGRHRRGHEDVGRRLVAHRRRRRLDGRRLRRRDEHGVVGHRQSGTALRLGRLRLEDLGATAGRQPLHHRRSSRSIPTPAG